MSNPTVARAAQSFNYEPVTLSADEGRTIAIRGLERLGFSREHAEITADHLVEANLSGYPFAGIARVLALAEELPHHPPAREMSTIHETPVSAVIDGGNNCGYVTVFKAAELAIEKAEQHGFAIVAVNNSFLSGRSAYYVNHIARAGFIGIHVAAASPHVAPYGGAAPVLGTNPIAIGIPATERPLVFDMGTSAIMVGEAQLAARTGVELPPNTAIDADGRPTLDAAAALTGALLPFGGHKGFGLSLMVQALGLLSRSYEATGVPNTFGFVHIVFSPTLLMDASEFETSVQSLADKVRAVPASGPQPVRLPGDRAAAERAHRLQHGIEVDRAVLDAIARL